MGVHSQVFLDEGADKFGHRCHPGINTSGGNMCSEAGINEDLSVVWNFLTGEGIVAFTLPFCLQRFQFFICNPLKHARI